ncbi:MAG: DUF4145 domain-containing protein, partial [Chloroflexi bacterium]|nr:DUF4145 domain-containing protein [Chloroflexota bacterium]
MMDDKLRASSAGRGFMPDVNCLGCGTPIYLDEKTYDNYSGGVVCPECKTPQNVLIENGSLRGNTAQSGMYDQIQDILAWEIPPDILLDLGEAARDVTVASYKSCAVMCGRALQAALLDQNIPNKELDTMIDEAKNKGVLTEELYQQAKAARFFRNTGAHPMNPVLRNVTMFQAVLGLEVVKQIL